MRRRVLQWLNKGIIVYFDGELLCFTAGENCQFSFTNDVYYSTDLEEWELLPKNTYSPTIFRGEKIWWYANLTPRAYSGIGSFSSTGRFNVSGNPRCLLARNTLVDYSFDGLFMNCANLINSSELILDSTTLANGCYNSMFRGCTSLTTAPELPAETLRYGCYGYMFMGCSSLTEAPELPATTLIGECYTYMFYNCTSLTSAPELPATTLADSCYNNMFNGCISLTQAPALPATTLASYCYEYMFYGCSSLNYVKSHATNTNAIGCLYGWLSGVSNDGNFYKPEGMDYTSGLNGIPSGWETHDIKYLVFEVEEGYYSSFKFTNSACYKTDNNTNWIALKAGDSTPTFQGGTKVYWMGDLVPNSFKSIGTFSSTGYFNVSGNPLSLLKNNELVNNCFKELFRGCNKLKSAKNLILDSLTLTSSCYNGMFQSCTALTIAPELPATTLASYCYQYMFYNCTSLTTAPDLNATTLANYCYSDMFYNCISLTAVPLLPAPKLADYCYQYMFSKCKSLTQVPELPATELAPYCYYYMFKDCTLLDTVQDLSATKLQESCYEGMFYGCTSLIQSPRLLATELETYCYCSMFYGCTSLETAPELNVTTLAVNCYDSMFYNCTSLTLAPELPATELTIYCYANMFSGCSKLNYIKSHAINITAIGCLYEWLSGVSSTGKFIGVEGVEYPTGSSGIPIGWNEHNVDYLTFEVVSDSSFKFTNTAQYSTDKINWIELPANTDTSIFSPGDEVYWKGELTPRQGSGIGTFSSTGQFNVSGNPNTLLKNQELQDNAFFQLFARCSGLIDASKLIMEDSILKPRCYYGMFYLCDNLSIPPQLPATTLADSCYAFMFNECYSLTRTPNLPATTLAPYCYRDMFSTCTALTKGPELPATILVEGCYMNMFFLCNNLNTLTCLAVENVNRSNLSTWLYLVASEGEFYGSDTSKYLRGSSGIPENWVAKDIDYLTFEVLEDDASFSHDYNVSGGSFPSGVLEYSTDKVHWYDTTWSQTPTFKAGTKVYWKGTMEVGFGIGSFYSGKKFNISGNPKTLLLHNRILSSVFVNLFFECYGLVDASKLVLDDTTLAYGCYRKMFSYCVNLTKAPILPAKTLAVLCYCQMFDHCSKLEKVICHATNNIIYYHVQSWLDNVASTGDFYKDPNITLTDISEFGIPSNWKIHDIAPLKFTALEGGQFSFTNDIQYKIDDGEWLELKANEFTRDVKANSVVYWKGELEPNYLNGIGTFSSTGQFSVSGDPVQLLKDWELVDYAFSSLFYNCDKLIDASLLILDIETLTPYCYSSMFFGCTSLIQTPGLPATTLAEGCYSSMFYGCTSLASAPELPAVSLVDYCYNGMFYGCSKLNYIKSYATDISATHCLTSWLNGVSSIGEFHKPADVKYSAGANDIPKNWTVIEI